MLPKDPKNATPVLNRCSHEWHWNLKPLPVLCLNQFSGIKTQSWDVHVQFKHTVWHKQTAATASIAGSCLRFESRELVFGWLAAPVHIRSDKPCLTKSAKPPKACSSRSDCSRWCGVATRCDVLMDEVLSYQSWGQQGGEGLTKM